MGFQLPTNIDFNFPSVSSLTNMARHIPCSHIAYLNYDG